MTDFFRAADKAATGAPTTAAGLSVILLIRVITHGLASDGAKEGFGAPRADPISAILRETQQCFRKAGSAVHRPLTHRLIVAIRFSNKMNSIELIR